MADEKRVSGTDVVAPAERFFRDLIGTVIPGLLLVVGWVVLFGQPRGRQDREAASRHSFPQTDIPGFWGWEGDFAIATSISNRMPRPASAINRHLI